MEDGVWRTVGGRRIFIKKGQDLASAMKESGKFKNKFEENIKVHNIYIKEINVENDNLIQEDYDDITKEVIKDVERNKIGLKYEVGTIIDKDGNVLVEVGGQEHAVDFNEKQLKQMKNSIMTHNHPTGFCFSDTDIYSYVQNDLYELRASTDSGKVFSIKKGSSKVDKIGFIKAFENEQPVAVSKIYKEFSNQINSGIIDKTPKGLLKCHGDLMSKWLKENSEKYGFIYKEEL